uniref:Nucleolar protein 8 n=1 Tax=Pogona vitticeps TaxID=103695 RepID=A0ABM5FKC5_9SAUR
MEQTAAVKRLYVGGLGHTISEEELQERFGKFGKVTGIEIVTRKDERGNPTKTFAYINVSLSEKELKKCISVLNKTKWKGGILQIELAKESFLHRLSRERQEASLKKEKLANNGTIDVVESMKKSGVVDFHVKAVPGTEVPDHKDWVVSKFGRVLPILHLKNQHKNKIIKYDPSKYCHNLKKLDQDLTEPVPISQLTWHLEEEGDGSISKKRQGQFPVTKNLPKKKVRVQDHSSLSRTELNSCGQFSLGATNTIPTKLQQSHTPISRKQDKVHSDGQRPGANLTSCKKINGLSESDVDSEEKIRALAARERNVNVVSPNVEQEDSMEIVGGNFELKYSTHWSLQRAHGANGVLRTTENKTDYDSADTDEIIAVTKTPKGKEKNGTVKEAKTDRGGKDVGPSSQSSDLNGARSGKRKGGERAASKRRADCKAAPKRKSSTSRERSEDNKSSDSCFDTSESEGDENYETMMQNCYRLEITLEDLERLASKNTESTDPDPESNPSGAQDEASVLPVNNTSSVPKTPAVTRVAKKGICPEEIISSLLEEDSDEETPKRRRTAFEIQPFRGIGSLCGEVTKGELGIQKSTEKEASSDHTDLEAFRRASDPWHSGASEKKQAFKSLSVKEINSHKGSSTGSSGEGSGCHTSNEGDNKVESTSARVASQNEPLKNPKSFPKSTKLDGSIKGQVQSNNSRSSCEREEASLDSARATHKRNMEEKQLQDNQKRLIALQERQKEREQQKKLIQGALTSLEIQSRNKQKHIVFDSDSENEAGVQEVAREGSSKNLGKEFTTKTSGKLFESSEDESNTENEDDDRFRIKPQFEGKSGEKLMRLQSQFGTDERFRMDARFLESDSEQEEDASRKLEAKEEEELALEKKKNLEILKNLVHIGVEPPKPSKQAASARKFKDMNALRYDPTRQDHAIFEKKLETSEKESKAKKKKREEAQKLPEVSKEIFYDVSVDLKEVFGSTKHEEKTEVLPWDKRDDAEQQSPDGREALNFSAGNNTQEESGGFTFSFFGAEEERLPVKEEPYTTETIKPARVAWQEDPRFQDSSSEEEEEDEPEIVQSEDAKETSPVQPRSSVRFFFFSQDDDRLKEGPKLFCKSSDLDEDRDDWETRRQMLLEDCRKKHKDARRKVKAK